LTPRCADTGFDEVHRTPDGGLTAIQYKRTSHDLRGRVPGDVQNVLAACPECAGLHGPAHGDLSASNLTVAASDAYFRDVDPTTIDVRTIVLIDGVGEASTVDLHDVVRELMPTTLEVLVVTDPDVDHLPWAGLSGAPVLASGDSRKVVRLLKHWNRVSRSDAVPSLSGETLPVRLTRQLAEGSARCAVRAAYLARDAVVRQDPKISRPIVARFAETWLGLRPTDATIDATGNALLQAPLDGLHPDGDHAAVRHLRTDVRDQRRAWRLIGQTQLCGRLVDSLDRRLPGADGDDPLVVADTVDGGMQSDLTEGWEDARLPRVLARLPPDELRVTLTKVYQGTTWTAAAQTCGMTAEFGERVRCKLKRLGADLTARIEAAKGRPRPA
jgi:hypothetical protein